MEITELEEEDGVIIRVPTEDKMIEVNLATAEEPRPVIVSKSLKNEKLVSYVVFLHEFKDVFAWTYTKMPGLDPSIAIHYLNIKPDVKHMRI